MLERFSWRRIVWALLFLAPLLFAFLEQLVDYSGFHRALWTDLLTTFILALACAFALWKLALRAIHNHLEAVESRTRWLAAAVDQMWEGILILDNNGNIRYANASCLEFLGRTSHQVIGMPLTRLLEELKEDMAFWRELQQNGSWSGELNVPDARGEERVLRGRAARVSEMGWLAVMQDVTEAKRLEIEAHRAAELAGILKTVSAINHEINNPLFVILANADMLERSLVGIEERLRARLAAIQQAGRRIGEVTRKLSQVVRPAADDSGLTFILDLDAATHPPGEETS